MNKYAKNIIRNMKSLLLWLFEGEGKNTKIFINNSIEYVYR